MTTKDSDPASWNYVPRGTCLKIVGGVVHEKYSDAPVTLPALGA